MKSLSPSQRTLRAKLAAHALHARYDSRAITANARAAFDQKFVTEVDPDGVLSEDERDRRAAHAKKAHFRQLALKSSRARSARPRSAAPGKPSHTATDRAAAREAKK